MLPKVLSLLVRAKLTQALTGANARQQHQWLWRRTMERIGYLGLKRVLGLDKFLDEHFASRVVETETKEEASVDKSSVGSSQSTVIQQNATSYSTSDRAAAIDNRRNDQSRHEYRGVGGKKQQRHVDRENRSSSSNSKSSGTISDPHSILPPFIGIDYDSIILVNSEERLEEARRDILNQSVLGFDTESKPDLYATSKRSGPHLLQLSTSEKTYLFSFVNQKWSPMLNTSNSTITNSTGRVPTNGTISGQHKNMSEESTNLYGFKLSSLFNVGNETSHDNNKVEESHPMENPTTVPSSSVSPPLSPHRQKMKFRREMQDFLREVLQSSKITKVGFGLGDDRLLLLKNLQIDLRNDVDLSLLLRPHNTSNLVGVKTAVKVYLKQDFMKSKRITISNWGIPMESLKMNQILYAANDAYAALLVYQAWLLHKNGVASINHTSAGDVAYNGSEKLSSNS